MACVMAVAAVSVLVGNSGAVAVGDASRLDVTVGSSKVVASTNRWVHVDVTTGSISEVTFEIVPAKDSTAVWTQTERVGDPDTGGGGSFGFEWRGRYENGRPVASGAYVLNVTSVPHQIDICGYPDCTQTRAVNLTVKNGMPDPDDVRPDTPAGLAVVAGDGNWLTWDANAEPDVVYYSVFQSSSKNGPWTFAGATAFTTYLDQVSHPDVVWYSVAAVDTSGNRSRRSGPVSNDFTQITATIGPAGGTIRSASGAVTLDIPAGALATPTDITITQMASPPAAPTNQFRSGRSFDITPHGLAFATPAQLTIRLDIPKKRVLAHNYPVDASLMGYFNTATGQWEQVTGATVDPFAGTISVPLAHLSSFGPLSTGDPHGGYGSTTNFCGWCHVVHSAPGPTLHPYYTEKQTCYQCHNGNQVSGPAYTVSGATWAGFKAMLTTVGAHGIVAGDPIVVTGVSPSEYNGSFAATEVTANTVTYTLNGDPGDYVSGGSVRFGYTSGATDDLVGQFGEATLNSTTKTSFHPVPAAVNGYSMTCSSCHTAHRLDTDYTKNLRVWDGTYTSGTKDYLYSTKAAPLGNDFCYNCHGTNANLPTFPLPDGDHTAFGNSAASTGSIHNTSPDVPFPAASFSGSSNAVTNASWAGGTATLTVGANTLAVGNPVVVSGVSPAGYNGSFAVTAATASTVSYALGSDPGAYVSGGAVASGGSGIKCLACHQDHASNQEHLTKANQENLCYQCHTGSANSSGGPAPTAPSDPNHAFTGSANDYTADANGIRLFHHPISNTDQPGGTRQVECSSCHNSHLADGSDNGTTTSKLVDPQNVNDKYIVTWADSGVRGNINGFCAKCHRSPTVTQPLTRSVGMGVTGATWSAGTGTLTIGTHSVAIGDSVAVTGVSPTGFNGAFTVTAVTGTSISYPLVADPGAYVGGGSVDDRSRYIPYTVKLVNDTADQADASPATHKHDNFDWNLWLTDDVAHGPAGGNLACTACHDIHGSSNAYMLRERVVSDTGVLRPAVTDWQATASVAGDGAKITAFCQGCHTGSHNSGRECTRCHYHPYW